MASGRSYHIEFKPPRVPGKDDVTGEDLGAHIEGELSEFLEGANPRVVRDDAKMDEAIRKITRQVAMEEIGKKPEVTVIISRLMGE